MCAIARIARRCTSSYSNGPVKHDRDLALRLDPLLDRLLDDAGRRSHADVLPRLLPADRRQGAEIALDQRLHRRQVEAADEDEREVAGVGEPVLVERQRLVEVPLVDAAGVCGRRRR